MCDIRVSRSCSPNHFIILHKLLGLGYLTMKFLGEVTVTPSVILISACKKKLWFVFSVLSVNFTIEGVNAMYVYIALL